MNVPYGTRSISPPHASLCQITTMPEIVLIEAVSSMFEYDRRGRCLDMITDLRKIMATLSWSDLWYSLYLRSPGDASEVNFGLPPLARNPKRVLHRMTALVFQQYALQYPVFYMRTLAPAMRLASTMSLVSKHYATALRATRSLCQEVHARFKSIYVETVASLREDDAWTTHNVSQNAERLKAVIQALRRLHTSFIWVLTPQPFPTKLAEPLDIPVFKVNELVFANEHFYDYLRLQPFDMDAYELRIGTSYCTLSRELTLRHR